MARSDTDIVIGRVIRDLRLRLGMRQAELAKKAKLGHAQTVSEIEHGQRALRAAEVNRLAVVLRVSASDILTGRVPRSEPYVLWRDPTVAEQRQAEEATFISRCRRYVFLEKLLGEVRDAALPQYPLDLQRTRYEDVEGWAEAIRDALGLGEVPAPALRETLEARWGIKLFRSKLQSGSAATTRGEYGNAIVEASAQPPGRRAFNLGHELFHLLTWDSIDGGAGLDDAGTTRNEQLANVFASALLMPEGLIRRAISRRRPDPARLIDLLPVARDLAVSLPALLWRLVTLELVLNDKVTELLSEPWGQTDPGWTRHGAHGPELPERYVLLAFRAWVQGEISVGKLAELLETTMGMLEPVLAEYGLELDADAYETQLLSA